MTKSEECKQIAKEYCKRIGADYIYSDLYSFGYEDKNGALVKKYWYDLYEEMKEKEIENNRLKRQNAELEDRILWQEEHV